MKKSAETRQLLLRKAFELIYINGYQAASIDDIIAETSVTKGAFYYHFKNKEEMGLAMIREVMQGTMQQELADNVTQNADPLKVIYGMFSGLLLTNPMLELKYGCPVYNLIQEMAPLNEQFNRELAVIIGQVRNSTKTALENAIAAGIVRNDTDAGSAADFILAGYGGIRVLGKLQPDNSCYVAYLKQLHYYLDSLRTN